MRVAPQITNINCLQKCVLQFTVSKEICIYNKNFTLLLLLIILLEFNLQCGVRRIEFGSSPNTKYYIAILHENQFAAL